MAGGILDALTEPRDAPSQVAKGVGNLLAFASFVATVFFCLMAYAAFNQGAWVLLILGGTLLFGLLSFAAKESRNSIPGYYSLRAARSIVYSLIVIVVVGSIFGVGKWGLDALVSTFGSTSARNSTGSDESSMASVQCERFVRERLKTPSTANFPFFADSSKKIDERRYVVQSHVDAENSFGAKLRNSYICVLEWNGQNHADINNWALVNFTIEYPDRRLPRHHLWRQCFSLRGKPLERRITPFYCDENDMTATATQTLPVSEAATVIRLRLGPLRNWTNFLTDNIRGHQDLAGHRLMPCGQLHDGRAYRPIYAVSDIHDFIDKVRASIPSAGKAPIIPITLMIDRSLDYRVNKFKHDGSRVPTGI